MQRYGNHELGIYTEPIPPNWAKEGENFLPSPTPKEYFLLSHESGSRAKRIIVPVLVFVATLSYFFFLFFFYHFPFYFFTSVLSFPFPFTNPPSSQRWALSPISVMQDIRLSLISEPQISDGRGSSPTLCQMSDSTFHRYMISNIRIIFCLLPLLC